MSPASFCPVERNKYWTIFDPARVKLVKQMMNIDTVRDSAFGLKLWREDSLQLDNWGGANLTTAFYDVAWKSCPFVVNVLGETGHF